MVQVVGKDNFLVKRTSCGKCASILEYTMHEVQKMDLGLDISQCPSGYEYIVCPSCGHHARLRVW